MLKLEFTHWKHGDVERDVFPTSTHRHWVDRATIWLVTESGNVYSAGRVINGELRFSAPIHIGWGGVVRAPSYDTQRKLAKKWGVAHGFEGRHGGWIYRNGRAICQGWQALFQLRRSAIFKWYREQMA